jgi:hypothetical protein
VGASREDGVNDVARLSTPRYTAIVRRGETAIFARLIEEMDRVVYDVVDK